MSVKPEVVKQLAELVDGDQWAMADLLVQEFPPEEWGDTTTTENNGIRDALREYEVALVRERGIELKSNTMRILRATALKWPQDLRVSSASFTVHKYLRGDDRYQRMERYLRLNNGKPLSERIVKRFRYDDNPPAMVPWDVALRRSIALAVKSKLLGGVVTKRADWWNAHGVSQESRDIAIAALRSLANDIERTAGE